LSAQALNEAGSESGRPPGSLVGAIDPCDCLYISPHEHDVALSCAARIVSDRQRRLRVLAVTVFEEQGPAGRSDETQRVWERLGVEHVRLGCPGAVFRNANHASFSSRVSGRFAEDDVWLAKLVALLDDLARRVKPQHVYFPLGVDGDIDHRLCHEAALSVFSGGEGRNVFLYEERPQALAPGAVRLRLAWLGAHLSTASAILAERSGLAPFLFRICAWPRLGCDRSGERLSYARHVLSQWREARAWRPEKALGPRLQPLLHPVAAEDEVQAVRDLAQTCASRFPALFGGRARFMRLASRHAARLGARTWMERYWLLLPPRGVSAVEVSALDLGP